MRWNRATLIGLGVALVLFCAYLEVEVGIPIPFVRIWLTLTFAVVAAQVMLKLFGWSGKLRMSGRDTVAFGEGEYRLVGAIEEKQAFAITFGHGTLDISHASPGIIQDSILELGATFGHATVYYSPKRPLRISVSSILGDVRLPNGSSAFVGDLAYRSPDLQGGTRCIHLKVTVFCGKLTFVAGSLPYDQEEDKVRV